MTKNFAPLETLVSVFRIKTMTPSGQWETAAEIKGNYQRFVKEMAKKRKRMSRIEDRLEWIQKARFGMFIHWGLYALPAGTWNSIDTPWVSEWIMCKMKISAREYADLAKKSRS